ncbi:MAG TPA: helix-turn-helix domain-containing protein [Acidobacteriota bacterium]|nr:helix-turn-helix domain-containing protein [Acidobacteriota bacterium]
MALPKVEEDDLLERLTGVFQKHGFEGASLSRISRATGLKRASLYHRFPGGKEEMAQAVIRHVHERFGRDLLEPLRGPDKPADKVRLMARRLDRFYDKGRQSCILDTLSLEDLAPLRQLTASAAHGWMEALAEVAVEAGASPQEARNLSEEAVIRVEGALILSRATGDRRLFEKVIEDLPRLLTGEDPEV